MYTLRRLKSMQQLPRRTFRRICAFVAASWALYFVGTPSCLALLAMASFLPELCVKLASLCFLANAQQCNSTTRDADDGDIIHDDGSACLSLGRSAGQSRTRAGVARPPADTCLDIPYLDSLGPTKGVPSAGCADHRPSPYVPHAQTSGGRVSCVRVVWILVAGILHATQTVSLTTRQWKRFACLSVSLCVDVSLACASIVRLLQARASLRSAALGSGAHYLTLVRILVFSSTLYTLGCVLTIVFRNNIYASAFYVLDATFLVSGSLAAGRADV